MPRLENAGMEAWLVRLFDTLDERNMPWISSLVEDVQHQFGPYLVDIVPSYTTVLVQFDALLLDHGKARQLLEHIVSELTLPLAKELKSRAVIELPIWYHLSVGPELARLSAHTGLSVPALIDLHSAPTYCVFALGFAPGFAFMGSLPEPLALARLTQPRAQVPQGSLAIAGRQTAIYPTATPGGWNILGRCPTPLFNLASASLSLLQAGDRVRFVPIDQAQFVRLGGDTTPLAKAPL
ncbi:allophanate hydrolase [Oceanisphaera avium]|uniref:Allophanate hydrolase n=2 Tax=Oceanisphaera avium TaxID=1903694 RepID=A0A1Y0D0Q4_9GAMM|nr:allophanate hydrolase [Oceanisphaera avium]